MQSKKLITYFYPRFKLVAQAREYQWRYPLLFLVRPCQRPEQDRIIPSLSQSNLEHFDDIVILLEQSLPYKMAFLDTSSYRYSTEDFHLLLQTSDSPGIPYCPSGPMHWIHQSQAAIIWYQCNGWYYVEITKQPVLFLHKPRNQSKTSIEPKSLTCLSRPLICMAW